MCFLLKWVLRLLGFMCLIMLTDGQDTSLSCGKRKVKTTYLVRGGAESKAGYWPWHVAIYHQGEYKCGGSIIDANTILTASHCVYPEHGVLPTTYVSVHVGRIHLNVTSNDTQVHDVQQIIAHPEYNSNGLIHDIALVKLCSNISMNKYVQPVCLWTMDSKEELIVGRNGTIVGFGLNEQDVVSDRLKQALIEVLDPLACIQMDRSVFGNHLTPDMFCGIGQAGVSACNGDSGGGMFFEERGKWFVRGLVSFIPVREHTALCDPLKPTAYTDVAKYLDWIKHYIDQRILLYNREEFEVDYVEKFRLFNMNTCGTKSSTPANGGRKWTIPWLGFVSDPNDDNFWCIITLINEWYAVGPAHCFEDYVAEGFLILGGSPGVKNVTCYHRKGVTKCSLPTQIRHIKSVTSHPEFDRNSYTHNIAVIELVTPADTKKANVKPICMPVTPELRKIGTTNLSVPIIYGRQYITSVPIHYVEFHECMKRNKTDNSIIENNQLCGIKSNNHSCYTRVSGFPLQETKLVKRKNRAFIRGIDLFGLTCETNDPTAYMNIEPYVDWILYNMRYHTIAKKNITVSSTEFQTLESQWIRLQQEPGKEKLRLFDMDTCGVTPAVFDRIEHVPWIGIILDDRVENQPEYWVVLISEWYVLAPKDIVGRNVVWRYVMLGRGSTLDEQNAMKKQLVEIKNIIIPPPEHHQRPFVLIELLEPADFQNPYITPICLPFMKELYSSKVILWTVVRLWNGKNINTVELSVMDRKSCLDRLLWKGVPLLGAISSCFIVPAEFTRNEINSAHTGSPFQMHVTFGDHQRYFLFGIKVHVPSFSDSYDVYQMDSIVPRDLEWIVENMQEKEQKNAFLTTTRDERVHLRAVKVPRSKRNLFNFNICGQPTRTHSTPWVGTVLSNVVDDRRSHFKCLVTLVSEWYAVGPAYCLNGYTESSRDFILFGNNCSDHIGYNDSETMPDQTIESCLSATQKIAVQKIIVHPQYNSISRINDIALIRLANPVNTSLPYVKPICLPIMDAIRDYDRSSLAVVANDTSVSKYTIINVDNRYVDSDECRERWNGLKANLTIDASNHCVMNQRTSDDECVTIPFGASLQSRQQLISSERHFLRGFAVSVPSLCSYYFPILYQSTDGYLDWMLETMEQPASVPFDLREELIFSR